MSRSMTSVATWPAGRRAKRWSKPSGTRPPDRAREIECLFHFENVVYAQDGRPAFDGGQARGNGAAQAGGGRRIGGNRFGDERLSAGPDHDGRAERRELVEAADELERMGGVLHVADARIERDFSRIHAPRHRS